MVHPIQLFGAAATLLGALNSPASAQPEPPANLPAVEVGVGVDAARMQGGLYLDGGTVLEPMVIAPNSVTNSSGSDSPSPQSLAPSLFVNSRQHEAHEPLMPRASRAPSRGALLQAHHSV